MSTKSYTDFASLLDGINSSIEQTLNTGVANDIKRRISQSARQNVIKQTSGRSAGGIDDMNNMKSRLEKKKNSMTLIVSDVAKPAPSVFGQKFDTALDAKVGGTMFANWIEHGYWVDLKKLLEYRMGQQWAWNPRDGAWSDLYGPQLAMAEGRYGAMTKKDMEYKPRREARPFIGPVQDVLNANPDWIIQMIENNL